MTKYDGRDEDRDNDGNKYGNNDANDTAGSGYDGTIFDPITMPRSYEGGLGENGDGTEAVAHYASMHWTITYVISTL